MTTTKPTLPPAALLLSDNRGIYIPRDFVEGFRINEESPSWTGITQEQIDILKDADHEYYWEAWDEVLNSATFTENGHTWRLHQDGDLWALCDTLMSREEKENFGFDIEGVPCIQCGGELGEITNGCFPMCARLTENQNICGQACIDALWTAHRERGETLQMIALDDEQYRDGSTLTCQLCDSRLYGSRYIRAINCSNKDSFVGQLAYLVCFDCSDFNDEIGETD